MAQGFDETCLSAAAQFGERLGTSMPENLLAFRLGATKQRVLRFCIQKPPWQGAFLPPVPVSLFAVTSLRRPQHNVNQSSHCHSDLFYRHSGWNYVPSTG